jgi:hypothetical protein
MQVSASRRTPLTPEREGPRCSLDGRLDGPQSWPGRSSEDKSFPLPEIDLRFFGLAAYNMILPKT